MEFTQHVANIETFEVKCQLKRIYFNNSREGFKIIFKGNPRVIQNEYFIFYTKSIQEAFESLNLEEIESLEIKPYKYQYEL